MTTRWQDAAAFFYEHAGYSYDPKTETPEQGRQRCANALADAAEKANMEGVRFEWKHDDAYADRSGIEHTGPLWGCIAWLDAQDIGSLWGIDLGENGDPWQGSEGYNYARVVEAELALEHFS